MDDSFKRLLFGLILFVLFATLMITLSIDFGSEYGKSASEIGGGVLNLTAFEESAESVESSTETYKTRFDEGDVDDVDSPKGILSLLKSMIDLILTPFNLLGKLLIGIGLPSLFVNVILGLLVIAIILGIWRILRAG